MRHFLSGAKVIIPLISCEIGTGTSFVNVSSLTGIVTPPTTYMPCAKPCNLCMTMTCSPIPVAEPPRHRYETLFRHEQMGEKYLAPHQDAMSG